MIRVRKLDCILTTTFLSTILITATPALAQTAAAAAPTPPAPANGATFNGTSDQQVVEVVVTGRAKDPNGVNNTTPGGGLMAEQTGTKVRNTVTRDYIAKQSATDNTFTLVKSLPGVVVSSGDSFGATDRMTLSVRGLGQTELGFIFEGMPVGDQLSYSAFPSEWADTENIGLVNMTRGSTDITAPVYNSVGALFQEDMITPSKEAGGFAELSFGNHDLDKEFLRFDTGNIGSTGIRGLVSLSHTYNENWRGPGRNLRYHVDTKFIKDWDNGNSVSLVATYNKQQQNIFTQPTMAQWKTLGTHYNYDATYTNGDINYDKLHIVDRESAYISAPSKFNIADGLQLIVSPYYLYTYGVINGARSLSLTGSFLGDTPAGVLEVPAGTPNPATVMTVDHYKQNTFGENSYLKWDIATSEIRLGYWYSHFVHNEVSAYEPVDSSGNVEDVFGKNGEAKTSTGQILRGFDGRLVQDLNGVYVDDTTKLMDGRLLLNAGYKYVWMHRSATDPMPGATYATGSQDAKALPQGSVRYSFDDSNQVFGDVTTAFRAPSAISSYIDLYNVGTGKQSSTHASNLKSEYSVGEEIGFRHHGLFNYSIAAFNYDLSNRLVTSSQIVNGTSVSFSVNVGRQVARGLEAEFGMRPWHHFSPYVSGQYLKATTLDDFFVNSDYLPTKGKTATLSPKFVGAAGLAYDNNHVFANLEYNYVDSQFTTFMDDEKMPAYHYANATVGYRFDNVNFAKHPQIELSVNNLFNQKYLSGAYGLTANALTTIGRNGTSIAGSAPTYYIGGGLGAMLSLSAGF